MNQGELFSPSRAPEDVIEICEACGREIVVQHVTHGHVESERRDGLLGAGPLGRCRSRT